MRSVTAGAAAAAARTLFVTALAAGGAVASPATSHASEVCAAPDARGTIYESHMTWMIATFWWTLFWVVVSFVPSLVLSVVSFGLLSFLFVIPGLWFLYRMIKGVLRLIDGRPVP